MANTVNMGNMANMTNAQQAPMNNRLPAGSNQPAPDSKPEEWTEEQLEAGLKHLKLLQIRCSGIRTTLPRMLSFLQGKDSATCAQVLADFTAAIQKADAELKDFIALYQSPESKRVLEQARKSRDAQPKGIYTRRLGEIPDWLYLYDGGADGS